LVAESFEKQIGQRLQQPAWRWCRRGRSAAGIEIEDELIEQVTSHLNPPLPSRSSMIGQIGAQSNKCREQLEVRSGRRR
jgi:hypothetical protein